MNIRKLYNPRTPSYTDFKKKVLGGQFKWEFQHDTLMFGKDEDVISTIECLTPEQKREKNWGGFPMYHHCILRRAEAPITAIQRPLFFPTVDNQELAMQASVMVSDILKANRIKLNMIFRMHLNAVSPLPEVKTGYPHTDHEYPHYNLLLYFTDAGGDTFRMERDFKYENYTPKEDDCIIFDGVHFHETPKEKRRVVFVCTYA
jgi:hypothetical protein